MYLVDLLFNRRSYNSKNIFLTLSDLFILRANMSLTIDQKTIIVGVEADFIANQGKGSALKAIEELIWNSLDAEATLIKILKEENQLGTIEQLTIKDNGIGFTPIEAEKIFSSIGGSDKRTLKFSPNKKRAYHGKHGRGRYKSFVLGELVEFIVTYSDNNEKKRFSVKLNFAETDKVIITPPVNVEQSTKTGVTIVITNIDDAKANKIFTEDAISSLQMKFAVYARNYSDISIQIEGVRLDFNEAVKSEVQEEFTIPDTNGEDNKFSLSIIEWKTRASKEIYLCNTGGVSYCQKPLRTKSITNTTAYLHSSVFEIMNEDEGFEEDLNPFLKEILSKLNSILKDYAFKKKHEATKGFIEQLVADKIYPFEGTIEDLSETEQLERNVFDIVALEINDSIGDFEKQSSKSKELTLKLLKESIESKGSSLKKILEEVINLPPEKVEEFNDLLGRTSLINIVNSVTDISDRLRFLQELDGLLYDRNINKSVLERQHLQKILEKETWVFGEKFAKGVYDKSLHSVLKEYLKILGREDLMDSVSPEDAKSLNLIPDFCLFRNYAISSGEILENLIVEIKRPTKVIGSDEHDQIKKYANAVMKDGRFNTSKTKWTFYLLGTKISSDLDLDRNQQHREKGHTIASDNYNVYVLEWNELIHDAKARHQFIKEKLEFEISETEEEYGYVKKKHAQYLPEKIFNQN